MGKRSITLRVGAISLASLISLLAWPTVSAQAAGGAAGQPADGGRVSWATAPANTELGKNRSHFEYTAAVGKRLTDAVAVVNRGDAPITLKVYASDAFTTGSGGLDLLAADKKPVDVGSWITMKTQLVTLKSQQSAVVPFTLAVPANASPGDHSGGIVTSLVTKQAGGVSLDRRLGSRVYLHVDGPVTPALTVTDVRASYQPNHNPAGGGDTRLTYTVTNTGNVRLGAHQQAKVSGPLGLLGRSVALADLPELLPGNSIIRTATISGALPSVRLSARITLHPVAADSPELAVPTTSSAASVWAWPWEQALILLLVIVLALAARELRRRRKRAVEAEVAAAVAKALEPTAGPS